MKGVNYYHKEVHLGFCSSSKSAYVMCNECQDNV